MTKTIIPFISSVLFLGACAYTTNDITTRTSEHEAFNYNGKTYQFSGEKININDPDNKWQAPRFNMNNFLKKTINNKLKKLGLKHSATKADIIISYGVDINMTSRTFKLFGNTKDGFYTDKPKSALTIIISNQKTNEVLWIAWANAQFKKLEKDKAKKRVEYAISKMFENFPD